MKEYGIAFRTPSQARMRYKKIPFNGSLEEKAYLLGFAIGDLHMYLPGKKSETLVARCHTTQNSQVKLFQDCFLGYGKVTVSKRANNRHVHLNAFLDALSFSFLLDKYLMRIPSWIKGQAIWSFIAGYNDAEGNLILNQGRARLKIDSYDYFVLKWIKQQLVLRGISCKLRKLAQEGTAPFGLSYNYKKDLWRLNVNKGNSLKDLLDRLLPYTKHAKRLSDLRLCLDNIQNRIDKGTI